MKQHRKNLENKKVYFSKHPKNMLMNDDLKSYALNMPPKENLKICLV